jgi:hypothetical protein
MVRSEFKLTGVQLTLAKPILIPLPTFGLPIRSRHSYNQMEKVGRGRMTVGGEE